MKNFLFPSLTLLMIANSCSKSSLSVLDEYPSLKTDCKCDTLRSYYERRHEFYDSLEEIRPELPPYIQISKLTDRVTPWKERFLGNFLDSVASSSEDMLRLLRSQMDSHQRVGPAWSDQIIRRQNNGSKQNILYRDTRYDDDAFGYWIAQSLDSGRTWQAYYTGITEDYGLTAKVSSKLPLVVGDSVVQFEAVRRITDESTIILPQITPVRKVLLEDSLLAVIPLRLLKMDSDHDGLTDIVEEKMLLNPWSADTDGDGQSDSTDPNPRFAPGHSDRTHIFEAIIDGAAHFGGKPAKLSDYMNRRKWGCDSNQIQERISFMLFSDDPDMQKVHPCGRERIIIVSSAEFLTLMRKYRPLQWMHLSPMFRCEGIVEKYEISFSELSFAGESIYVLKTANDWIIAVISSWIS